MTEPLYGLVLAGGRSARMGRDKGAISWQGRAQTQHLAALLAPYTDQAYVSIREEQQSQLHVRGLRTITDYYKTPSPLNGIASAMRQFPNASWLVIAVDMPYIDAKAIEILIAKRNKNKAATCFESPVKGGSDPLFAIWEGHVFSKLELLLAEQTEHICPRSVLTSLPTELLRDSLPARALDNINTPEELSALTLEAV